MEDGICMSSAQLQTARCAVLLFSQANATEVQHGHDDLQWNHMYGASTVLFRALISSSIARSSASPKIDSCGFVSTEQFVIVRLTLARPKDDLLYKPFELMKKRKFRCRLFSVTET